MSGILLAHRHAFRKAGLPAIGAPFMGGFFAGVIDTTRGNILAGDNATTGKRFALICGPQSMEFTTGTGGYRWDSVGSRNVPFQTRWDGFTATQQFAAQATGYEAFKHVWGIADPGDGASKWYVPSLDEFDLLYKSFKPTVNPNYNPGGSSSGVAPTDSQVFGYNPSADPQWLSGYTSGSPAQTLVAAFIAGAAQALAFDAYRVGTQSSSANAWGQYVLGATSGWQLGESKTATVTTFGVRPVRRLVLA